LLWGVLLCNVSAGIGVIGMASPMLQEVFGGRLIGSDRPFEELDAAELARTAAVAAGFTGLLSLFNIVGRLFWSSLSDRIGRRVTYAIFLVAGAGLFALVPAAGRAGSVAAFCGLLCLALTMYGGGFAAIPAYLADLFGTGSVGAIHGRILTAWSVAGVLGPVLVNYLNEAQVRAGFPRARAYDQTMLALAVVLLAGAVCNWLVRPLEAPAIGASARGGADTDQWNGGEPHAAGGPQNSAWGLVITFWCLVGLPLAWGVWSTLRQTWMLLG
jgi:MFS family permease